MKMHNMGETRKEMGLEGEEKTRIHYPSMYVSGEKFPEIHQMKVGDVKTMQVKVKMRGYSKRDSKDGTHSNGDFDIMEMGIMGASEESGKKMKEMDKADSAEKFGKLKGRIMAEKMKK